MQEYWLRNIHATDSIASLLFDYLNLVNDPNYVAATYGAEVIHQFVHDTVFVGNPYLFAHHWQASAQAYLPWIVRNGAPSTPLLANSSFEEGAYRSDGTPTGWTRDAWQSSTTAMTWDSTEHHQGLYSVRIRNDQPNDARWVQTVQVSANTNYRLSGWIKTQDVAHAVEVNDVGANLCLMGGGEHSAGLLGTNGWTFVAMLFNSGSRTSVTVGARLGFYSGTTTGTAWFDDLRLERQ